MFPGDRIASLLSDCGITHVVTVPDSTVGQWEGAIEHSGIRLIRVCREGEAWAVAAGLYLGGARPLVVIQCTGLFESGDALRNVVHDYRIPLFAIIGYRSYLIEGSPDTARTYTEPFLKAFDIPYRLLTRAEQLPELAKFYEE